MTQMNNLQKAVLKAVENGWNPESIIFDSVDDDRTGYAWCGTWDRYSKMVANHNLPPNHHPEPRVFDEKYRDIIFNQDFAKALWGLEPRWHGELHSDKMMKGEGVFLENIATCDYHLMQMVIADDPIKYLGDNI